MAFFLSGAPGTTLAHSYLIGDEKRIATDSTYQTFSPALDETLTLYGTGFVYSGAQLIGGLITGLAFRDAALGDYGTISGLSLHPLSFQGIIDPEHLTSGDDIFVGTASRNWFRAGAGADVLYGYGDDDQLFGEDGADWLYGGAGNDELNGGGGADFIVGDFGAVDSAGLSTNDRIRGGLGADILLGGAGDDEIDGDEQNALSFAGDADWLFGGGGADTLRGEAGADVLIGDIDGESGADLLEGGMGADILIGGAGADRLYADGYGLHWAGQPGDWMFGGDGDDLLVGGSGRDVLYGDLFAGETGVDQLDGQEGADYLLGGPGADPLSGGDGDDWLYGQGGADSVTGGGGADLFWFQTAADAGDVIADFAPALGDRLVLYPVHQAAGWAMTTQAAFAAGIYGLVAWNGDTLLTYDADAAGPGAALTLATLKLVAPSALNIATDFI